MEAKKFDFLKSLIETPSPSGFEWSAQAIYRKYIKPFCDNIETDVMGSVIASQNSEAETKIMLAGHIDEIGLMVHYIDESGFLYFDRIGGVDPSVLPGSRVFVHTDNKKIPGVIGRKAIHLLEDDERRKEVKITDLWVDIGVKNKKEAEKLVRIGDPITVGYELEQLEGNKLVSRAFDDKIGVFVVAHVLEALKSKKLNVGVFGVSTTQEELGLRGARTSAYSVDAQIGIAIDVTHGNDFPAASKAKDGDIELGKGPVISRGANINPVIEKLLIETAKANKIPYQIEASPCSTGTDANIMQMNKSGMATALVSIPLRYMHTPSEILDTSDVENAIKLISLFIQKVKPGINLIP